MYQFQKWMGDPNNCIVVNLKMKIECNVFPLHNFLQRITKNKIYLHIWAYHHSSKVSEAANKGQN